MIDKLPWLSEARWRDSIGDFVRYAGVSGVALIADVAVYASLLNVAKFAALAACGGYVGGVLTNYTLSSRLVFSSHFEQRGLVAEAPIIAKFFVAALSGLVVTVLMVGLLADLCGIHPLIAKVVAAGFSFVSVFLCMRLFVFNASAKGPTLTSNLPRLSSIAR